MSSGGEASRVFSDGRNGDRRPVAEPPISSACWCWPFVWHRERQPPSRTRPKQEQAKQDQSKQDIPDAPSATRPFPGVPPPSSSNPGPPPSDQAPPPNQPPPSQANPNPGSSTPSATEDPVYAPGVAPAPPFKVTTVPEGAAGRATRRRRTVQDQREHQPGRGSGDGKRRFWTPGKRACCPGILWFSKTARNRL